MGLRINKCINDYYTPATQRISYSNAVNNIWEKDVAQQKQTPVQKENFKQSRVEYDTFEMFPNGKVKTWVQARTGDEVYGKIKYEYNKQGQIIKQTFYNSSYPDSNDVELEIVYNYQNGKPVSKTFKYHNKNAEPDTTYPIGEIDKYEMKKTDGASAGRRLKDLRKEKQNYPNNFIK